MNVVVHWRLTEVEKRVCDVVSEQVGVPRHRVTPNTKLGEDLGVDSLDFIELLMELEATFAVDLSGDNAGTAFKSVFTRQPFRLRDLAELIYLQQGTGTPDRPGWFGRRTETPGPAPLPFTQLGGRWEPQVKEKPLSERLTKGPAAQYRRRSDGMRCVLIPSAAVEIGCDASESLLDERPLHIVEMSSYLIDAEPVSTTAYCRFLNSVGPIAPEGLADLFVLDSQDNRNEQMPVTQADGEWQPVVGTERWPMVLVSWYGANAYSLWANGWDWLLYREDGTSFLPSEAQWEYAARGPRHRAFPWGGALPSQEQMRFGQHARSASYRAETMAMAEVNVPLGVSPFGLHHMAGNVWQWCRDWYDESFYSRSESRWSNPENRQASGVRSERGGSWVGPADLCRSSFRRGRPPRARGRCLGFRCVSYLIRDGK